MTVTLDQSPDHVALLGQTVLIDGDPYIVDCSEPVKHEPSFLDWGQVLQPSRVVLTLSRSDGNPE